MEVEKIVRNTDYNVNLSSDEVTAALLSWARQGISQKIPNDARVSISETGVGKHKARIYWDRPK